MKKSNKKIKIKKKDLDKFSPDRIMSDFDSVNSVLSKIDFLDENLTEEDALTLQTELQQIESYLNNQYKEYIDSNIKDVNLSDIDVELESDEIDENVEDNLDSEE
ncbi:MAG: hypothetical protein HOB69_01935 [Flavobacterium sp.]|jgi:hypothetical protein|nr:hypothetical protein [Flavobacterium sp.]|tara:strand:+ start:296 stop:610 length:315 start_codon:yes stop_codon:yes gene_type:complete